MFVCVLIQINTYIMSLIIKSPLFKVWILISLFAFLAAGGALFSQRACAVFPVRILHLRAGAYVEPRVLKKIHSK